MPKLKKLSSVATFSILASIISVFSTSASAAQNEIPKEEIEKFQRETSDIRSQALPMGRVMVTQKNGTTAIMSDNGRFRFSGPIIDTWAEIEIKAYEDALYSAEHLPMHNIGLKSEMLAPLIYGDNEGQTVLVFLSPDDPASRDFLAEMPSMKKDFRFELVVVPSSRTPSALATAYSCVENPERALELLMSGKDMLRLSRTKNCDLQMLNNRMIAFNLLGFYDLPTVIAPSTRLAIGKLDGGWKNFLMENLK